MQVTRRRGLSIAAVVTSTGLLAGCGDGASVTGLRSSGPDGLWVREIAVDPRRSEIAYAAGTLRAAEGLFKTTDGGATWSSVGPVGTDDAEAVAVDPFDPDLVLAVFWDEKLVTYTVYKSLDGGHSWHRANRGLVDARVLAIAIDHEDNGVAYAVAATAASADPAAVGTIFKSTDGGESWTPADAGLERKGAFGPQQIVRVVVSESLPGVVFGHAQPGLFASADGGRSWRRLNEWHPGATLGASQWLAIDPRRTTIYAADGGTLVSSVDRGRTWQTLRIAAKNVAIDNAAIHAVAVDPSRRGTLYVSLTDHVENQSWLLKSTTGGASWVVVAEASGRTSANTAYGFDWLAVDSSGRPVYVGTYDDGVLVCDECASITSP